MEQTVQKSATQVHHLHSVTSSRLMTVDLDAELRTAALLLANPGVGLVVICAKGGEAAGVLSKSDLVRHLATSKSNEAMVRALMSRPIVSCGPDDDLHSVWETMAGRSLQNIPVLDAASKPIGILDIRDALKALLQEEEIQEHMLTNYIAGVGYQ
ncbi:CBS domain-containing protein [Rhizobium sp. LjRoot254]|uniref:CBS domain-containing protein n=1 Tax=Rhizobium sp. LjRoot254 TaxID=3342297 RepID=UPI003ECEC15A